MGPWPVTDQSPAALLREAARLMRERAGAVKDADWGHRPWAVTECSECYDRDHPGEAGCPCIVYQGEYKPPDEPQVPEIQYVADTEAPEFAAWIASMGPHVGLPLADLLDEQAAEYEEAASGIYGPGVQAFLVGDAGGTGDPALAVARAYLDGGEQR